MCMDQRGATENNCNLLKMQAYVKEQEKRKKKEKKRTKKKTMKESTRLRVRNQGCTSPWETRHKHAQAKAERKMEEPVWPWEPATDHGSLGINMFNPKWQRTKAVQPKEENHLTRDHKENNTSNIMLRATHSNI